MAEQRQTHRPADRQTDIQTQQKLTLLVHTEAKIMKMNYTGNNEN